MSSRQSANAASGSGFQYAAPATYALAQINTLQSNEASNPQNFGLLNGTGANTGARQLLAILPVSVAVATPAAAYGSVGAAVGLSGLTSSATTATCNLGNPHGFAIGASSVLVSIVNSGNPAYNVSAVAATITGPYSFTYTTVGSGLAASGGGTASMSIPNSAGTGINNTGIAFSQAVPGLTIQGQVVGSLEFWSDQTVWDLSNNRPISTGVVTDPAVQYKSS